MARSQAVHLCRKHVLPWLVRAGHNRVDLENDDPAAVQLMLEWFYCKQYINPPISAAAWTAFRATNDTDPKALVLCTPDQTNSLPSALTDNDLKHAILLYLKVFDLATSLDSEGLCVYASWQFNEKIVECICKSFLVDVLKEVCTVTMAHDELVRPPLFRACLTRLQFLREQLPDAVTLLEQVEPQGCFFAQVAHDEHVRRQQLQSALDEHKQKLRAE